jgi:glycerophosphoryl diester phosphodiesterase
VIRVPRIIGHRGEPAAAPENTLASFRQAAKDGARWVEFDATLTADGRPVVFHDDALDRTTDGNGLLDDTTFEALRSLDAGSWYGPQFAGELVPTLEEVLEQLAELGLGFNMEIKPARGRESETARVTLATATACWPASGPTPLVTSFSRVCVAAAKEQTPQWPRGLIFDRVPDDWREIGKQLAGATFGADHRHLTPDQVREMTAAGYQVTSYTVNDAARARTLFDWGVAAIFTDNARAMTAAFPES